MSIGFHLYFDMSLTPFPYDSGGNSERKNIAVIMAVMPHMRVSVPENTGIVDRLFGPLNCVCRLLLQSWLIGIVKTRATSLVFIRNKVGS